MDKKHVLVVDDEQNMLLAIQFILEVENYRVTTAEDGQDALNKILAAKNSGNDIALLILDIQMPRLTGLELMDELNRLKVAIPILVITGHGSKELAIGLMRRGCCEYLDKPFDDEELIERVAILLEKEEKE